MNRLKGSRAYLCGPMDLAKDGGVGWRREIGSWLHFRGVKVFDPCNKPIDLGVEDAENRHLRLQWKEAGDFDKLSADMRIIRSVDLRMVDIVDFLVVNLDLEVPSCGTWEELFLANGQKKPIVVRFAQGKNRAPDWLFGTIPHDMIFGTWAEVHQYLEHIDRAKDFDAKRRWYFFKHRKQHERDYVIKRPANTGKR